MFQQLSLQRLVVQFERDSYQRMPSQLAEKWMFFCKTLLVSAFSRLLPVRFLCTRLDFDPAANARSCA